MPFSYSSGSSSSEGIWACPYARADANYGIPERCFCGRCTVLEKSTATATFGRKFYSCLEILGEENDEHIWKWWDEGVTEQLEILQNRLAYQKEMMQSFNRIDLPSDSQMESRLAHMRVVIEGNGDDILEMKLQVEEIQRDIAWLKEAYTNKCSDIVLLALFVVFAVMTFLFK
ncbi:uncharacterized protein At4g04775-like [Eutrema salsugineum]|uniref:uncharacterized protein At4g04775-like n=1 Tax=Eutrema salsugineum TaxID=72664 RepID=UPI000CED298F|nr:uncharacterized protein At4g04775-like [Eutrema salsugineum]